METIKNEYKRSRTTQSAEKVASNDDLLTAILLRLPTTSVSNFKFVSKHWFSLITSPNFSLPLIPDPMAPSGLFLRTAPPLHKPIYQYIPFNNETPCKPPFQTLAFTPEYYGINILQSCNGSLFCCCSERDRKYYIYNPTTKQCKTLSPLPGKIRRIFSMVLAFDPSKSLRYKVICIRQFNRKLSQIMIYSSQTESWKVCGQPFTSDHNHFRGGVYLNGVIHWISTGSAYTYYFKIDEEQLKTMPMPPLPNTNVYVGGQTLCGPSYFGVSRAHLHHVETYGPRSTVFDVYEMEKDYSKWFVKYHVDLGELPNVFPGPYRTHFDPEGRNSYRIQILSIVRGQREEDSFLVLEIPGKILLYNLVKKTLKKLYDCPSCQPNNWDCGQPKAFEFIETLSVV